MRYTVAILALLAISAPEGVQGFARKEIPAHLQKQFGLVDPKKKHIREIPITADQITKPERNTYKKKTEDDVRRVKPKDMHVEEIHEDEVDYDKDHFDEALDHHFKDINRREQDHRKMLSAAGFQPITHEDRNEEGDLIMEFDEDGDVINNGQKVPRIADDDKPRPGHPHFEEDKPKLPMMAYLADMLIDVYFREHTMKHEQSLESHAITIETELRDHEIDYQSLNIREGKYVQIMCNDPEEREHIRHLVLKNRQVLALENEQRRYFTKWAKKDEKEHFKLVRADDKRRKNKDGSRNEASHQNIKAQVDEDRAKDEL